MARREADSDLQAALDLNAELEGKLSIAERRLARLYVALTVMEAALEKAGLLEEVEKEISDGASERTSVAA